MSWLVKHWLLFFSLGDWLALLGDVCMSRVRQMTHSRFFFDVTPRWAEVFLGIRSADVLVWFVGMSPLSWGGGGNHD